MRIVAEAADAAWGSPLAVLATVQGVYGWHILGSLITYGAAADYWFRRRLTASQRRLALPRANVRGDARPRLRRLSDRLWLTLLMIAAVLALTGAFALFDSGVSARLSTVLAEVHQAAAWALLVGVVAHVAVRQALVSVVETDSWAPAAIEADWLISLVPPRHTPAMAATAAESNLRAVIESRMWRRRRSQLRMYLTGCLCFALGIKCFIDADLGVDPLHAMTIGIVQAVDTPYLGIGFVDSVVTAVFLGLWMAWNRRWPPLAVFVTMALVGYLIDLLNLLGVERWTETALAPAYLMLAGLLLQAYGSALIIMSAIGMRVMDLVAITMVRMLGWRFYAAKLSMEAGFFLVAWLLGGPVGAATVTFLVVVPLAIEPFIWVNGRYFRMLNLGMPISFAPAEVGPRRKDGYHHG